MRGANAHIIATAYHEAGHALAALREGVPVQFAQVSRRVPGAGRVRLGPRINARNPFDPSASPGAAKSAWEISLQRCLVDIRIKLAGPLAEAKYLGLPLRTLGAWHDLVCCERIAKRLGALHEGLWHTCFALPPFCPYEQIARERKAVRRWIGRPSNWRSITAIAEALLERERLSGEELLQINLMARTPAHQPVLPLVRLTRETEAAKPLPTHPAPVHFGCWSLDIKVPAPRVSAESVPAPAKVKVAWLRMLPWIQLLDRTENLRTW